MTLVLDRPDLRLYLGDAREILRELDDESVDAIVTSPPYADVVPALGGVPALAFAAWMEPFGFELLRVLKPTGGFMLNLGRVFRGGEDVPVAEETLIRLRGLGWKRIDTIVWAQSNGRPIGPSYLADCHEYVYWLARDHRAYRGYTYETRRPHAEETLARYGRRWSARYQPEESTSGSGRARARTVPNPEGARPDSIFVGPTGVEKGNAHPTPMDPAIARYLVALSCPPGGVVLDPFLGSGNVLREAISTGRSGIGIEIDERWIELAADRLAQPSLLHSDAAAR